MEVYDCKQKTDFTSATLLWDTKTNQKLTSVAGKNVIKGGKASWDFYWQLFGRNSIDNKGLLIKQYVHYDKGMDNAYWDGRRMVYGDGDGVSIHQLSPAILMLSGMSLHMVLPKMKLTSITKTNQGL